MARGSRGKMLSISIEALHVGSIVDGRYEVIDTLGEGGFGVVYKARQIATDQLVALKVLIPTKISNLDRTNREMRRFKREIQLIAKLQHPNIVRLVDAGRLADGRLYMALEFIHGEELGQVLDREGRLDPLEAKFLMLQVLDALSAAHAKGIVHRDLKPANIMITRQGACRNAMVVDFGIGTILENTLGEKTGSLTLTGQILGTPSYMAPEQLRGEVTLQSDLYAWGLLLYECLTGRRAVTAESVYEVIHKQLSDVPVEIPSVLLSSELGRLIFYSTVKDLKDRYPSVSLLHQAFSRCDVDAPEVRAAIDSIPPPEGGRQYDGDSDSAYNDEDDEAFFRDIRTRTHAVNLEARKKARVKAQRQSAPDGRRRRDEEMTQGIDAPSERKRKIQDEEKTQGIDAPSERKRKIQDEEKTQGIDAPSERKRKIQDEEKTQGIQAPSERASVREEDQPTQMISIKKGSKRTPTSIKDAPRRLREATQEHRIKSEGRRLAEQKTQQHYLPPKRKQEEDEELEPPSRGPLIFFILLFLSVAMWGVIWTVEWVPSSQTERNSGQNSRQNTSQESLQSSVVAASPTPKSNSGALVGKDPKKTPLKVTPPEPITDLIPAKVLPPVKKPDPLVKDKTNTIKEPVGPEKTPPITEKALKTLKGIHLIKLEGMEVRLGLNAEQLVEARRVYGPSFGFDLDIGVAVQTAQEWQRPPLSVMQSEMTWGQIKLHQDRLAVLNTLCPSATPLAPGEPHQPVTNIGAAEAAYICESLGMRLPTANEWEAIARGDEQRIFATKDGGQLLNDAQLADLSSRRSPGALEWSQTPEGIFDLSGGVREWVECEGGGRSHAYCRDIQDEMSHLNGLSFAVRGGSWLTHPFWFQTYLIGVLEGASETDPSPACLRAIDVGFRCVRDEEVKAEK